MGTLRFLLALSVVIDHSAPLLGGLRLVSGPTAVQAFFLISGFYMSLILNEKYPATGRGIWLFYSNRFLRIYPIYWLTLLAAAAGILVFGHTALALWKEAFSTYSVTTLLFLIVSNLTLVGIDASNFLGIQNGALVLTDQFQRFDPPVYFFLFIPQAWTLGLEIFVYALAPFLFRRSVWLLTGLAFASFGARAIAFKFGLQGEPWTYRFMPFEFGFFIVGAIVYRVFQKSPRDILRRCSFPAVLVMVALTLAYDQLPVEQSIIPGLTDDKVIYLGSLALLTAAIFSGFSRVFSDGWLGNLSYPLYLCHTIVTALCHGQFGTGDWRVVVGSTFMAILIMVAVERPINRYRQSRIVRGVAQIILA